MSYLTLEIVSLCIMLMSVETLHGIARAAILVPRIGKKTALKLSIISGSVLAFIVCYFIKRADQGSRNRMLWPEFLFDHCIDVGMEWIFLILWKTAIVLHDSLDYFKDSTER